MPDRVVWSNRDGRPIPPPAPVPPGVVPPPAPKQDSWVMSLLKELDAEDAAERAKPKRRFNEDTMSVLLGL